MERHTSHVTATCETHSLSYRPSNFVVHHKFILASLVAFFLQQRKQCDPHFELIPLRISQHHFNNAVICCTVLVAGLVWRRAAVSHKNDRYLSHKESDNGCQCALLFFLSHQNLSSQTKRACDTKTCRSSFITFK